MEQQSKKVLVVDDEQSLLFALSAKLTSSGYKVLKAKEGSEGLLIAINEKPDVILLDVSMPRMNGVQMLDELRKDAWGNTAKVIILSNLDPTDELLETILENKPAFYLMKAEIALEGVMEKVQELLTIN